MLRDLNSILDYVDRLNQLDTTDVPPMAQVSDRYGVDESKTGSARFAYASREDILEGLRKSLPHEVALRKRARLGRNILQSAESDREIDQHRGRSCCPHRQRIARRCPYVSLMDLNSHSQSMPLAPLCKSAKPPHVALAESFYSKIEKDDPQNGAYLMLSKDRALAKAAEIDASSRKGREAAAAGWRSGWHQGCDGNPRRAYHRRLEDSGQLYSAVRLHGGGADGSGGRDCAWAN